MKFVQNQKYKRLLPMNNHHEVSASLMGRMQGYDDTALRKRVTCLTSTLVVCFLLAAAGLGVSVIVLLKFNQSAVIIPQTLGNQTKLIGELKKQITQLQQLSDSKVSVDDSILLRKIITEGASDEAPTINIDNVQTEKKIPKGKNDLSGIQIEEKPRNSGSPVDLEKVATKNDLDGIQIEERPPLPAIPKGYDDLSGYQIEPIQSGGAPVDLEKKALKIGGLDGIQIEEPPKAKDPKPESIFSSNPNFIEETDFYDDVICDDSDLCGSGSGEEHENTLIELRSGFGDYSSGDYGSGSGSGSRSRFGIYGSRGYGSGFSDFECPPYARPVCPKSSKICYDYDLTHCLVPICCLLGS